MFETLNNQDLEASALRLATLETRTTGELIEHLAEIQKRRLFVYYSYASLAEYCRKKLFLREDQAYKRAQAAKLSARHPICLDLLRAGKISLTSINIAAAKITDKNSVEIFKAMQEKSNQDLKFYLSTIDENGKPKKDAQETMEVKLLMTKACHQKWLKAKALVSHNKKQIDNGAALESILDQYLERHDPLKKAERASKRNTDKRTSGHVTVGNAPAKRYISKSLYHQVMLKDEGQCSFVDEVGKRCCEQRYLEVDHKKLFSRNQEHKLENLQILCSSHNRLLAERELSVNFIRDKISGAK